MVDVVQSRTFARRAAKDIEVTGRLLNESVQMKSEMGPGDVWSQIELWELANGDWLVARSQDHPNVPEGRYSETAHISMPAIVSESWEGPTTAEEARFEMIDRTMKFLEWSWLAKKFAGEMGWAIKERLS